MAQRVRGRRCENPSHWATRLPQRRSCSQHSSHGIPRERAWLCYHLVVCLLEALPCFIAHPHYHSHQELLSHQELDCFAPMDNIWKGISSILANSNVSKRSRDPLPSVAVRGQRGDQHIFFWMFWLPFRMALQGSVEANPVAIPLKPTHQVQCFQMLLRLVQGLTESDMVTHLPLIKQSAPPHPVHPLCPSVTALGCLKVLRIQLINKYKYSNSTGEQASPFSNRFKPIWIRKRKLRHH